jgi:hypothetical protein
VPENFPSERKPQIPGNGTGARATPTLGGKDSAKQAEVDLMLVQALPGMPDKKGPVVSDDVV